MNSGIPWQIEGVERQARDTAQDAARRAGLSLGEWLDAIILNSARNDLSSGPGLGMHSVRPTDPSLLPPELPARGCSTESPPCSKLDDGGGGASVAPAGGEDVFIRAAELVERLTQIRAGDSYRPVVDEGFARLNERLDGLTLKLSDLVAGHAARTAVSHAGNNEAPTRLLETLERKLDQLANVARPGSSFDDGGQGVTADSTPLDVALQEIASRQRMLDGSPPIVPTAQPSASAGSLPRARTQDLSGLEQQLRQINVQIEQLKQPSSLDKAVDTLRNDLAEIGVMLQEAMPRRAIEALESEIRQLAGRIEETRPGGADGATLASIEQGLVDMRDSLRALKPAENLIDVHDAVDKLARKIDGLGNSAHDPGALAQLESAIATMRGIVGQVASNEALSKLSEEVRRLADKVDQAADTGKPDILAALESRIATLADALAAHNQTGHAHNHSVDLDGLVARIERAQLSRNDQVAVGHFEDRITRLVDKLEASDARFQHLEAIERGMAELLVHVEQQRAFDHPTPGTARSSEIDVLAQEVSDLKQSEKQTQDALEAVHGTLGHVVDRLAMIETGLRDQPVQPTLASRSVTPEPSIQPPPETSESTIASTMDTQRQHSGTSMPTAARHEPNVAAEATSSTSPDTASNAATATSERRPIDPSLPPDHPLEPGTGVSRSRTPNSPADRIAASEAALAGSRPPVISDPAGKSSFIAAARRAAQAAGREAPAKEAAATETTTAAGRLASGVGKLRALLGGTAAILLLLGAIQTARVLLDNTPEQEAVDPRQVIATPAAAPTSPPAEAAGPTETMPPAPPAGRQSAIPAARDAGPSAAAVPSPIASSAPQLVTPTETTSTLPRSAMPNTASGAKSSASLPTQTVPDRAGIGSALKAAALKGDPAAQFELGMRLAEGRGVPQSMSEAAEWLERAAKQGLAPARFRLGGLYEKGLGVQKNPSEARRLYLAAGEAGHAKALHNLAVLYAEGIDGKPDYQIAAKWFRKAADYGITDSQYNLAILYARGIGVEQSLTESYKWFALAARDGDPEAAKKRDEIGARLAPQQISAAAQALESWKPQDQPDAAINVKIPPGGWDSPATAGNPPSASLPAARRKPQAQTPTLDLSPVSQTR